MISTNIIKPNFLWHSYWQNQYYAVSVSQSGVPHVRNYIRRQEEHHGGKTFEEEVDEFVKRFGFKRLVG